MNGRWICLGMLLLSTSVARVEAGEPETVILRGDRLLVWPVQNLIDRGFDVKVVPREQNAAWVYIEAANAYVDLPEELAPAFNQSLKSSWPADDAKLRAYLDLPGNKRCVRLAHKAAAMKHHQMPCFGDAKSSAISMMLPNLSYMRFVAKLLVVDAKRLAADGKHDEALDSCITVMRAGSHVGDGVTIIQNLVGIAIWRLGSECVLDMVLRGSLSSKQLRKVLVLYNGLADRVPSVQRAIASERVFALSFVDELCSRPFRLHSNWCGLLGVASIFGEPPGVDVNPMPDDGWGKLELRIGQLMIPDRAIKRHMAGFYDKLDEMASGSVHPYRKVELDEEHYVFNEIPHWDVIARLLLPSLSRAVQIGTLVRTDLAIARTSIALRLYMLEHEGEIPESLQAVVDDLPDDVALDPFSGHMLGYIPSEYSWLLYSVGPDGVDDGGKKGKRWDELDIVQSFPPAPPVTDETGSLISG